MHTVGQILKETREEKLLSLEEVEKATKIRQEILRALENDDYSKLPPATFIQGFIKNYGKFLGLDSNKLMAIFRREFSDKRFRPYIMTAFTNPIEKRGWNITPSQLLAGIIGVIIIGFFGYLWIQYRYFVGSPSLEITSPADQATTSSPEIVVSGRTDPEMSVTINNQDIAVDANGNFKETITLSSQVDKIMVVASSRFGQRTEADRTVYLKSNPK